MHVMKKKCVPFSFTSLSLSLCFHHCITFTWEKQNWVCTVYCLWLVRMEEEEKKGVITYHGMDHETYLSSGRIRHCVQSCGDARIFGSLCGVHDTR